MSGRPAQVRTAPVGDAPSPAPEAGAVDDRLLDLTRLLRRRWRTAVAGALAAAAGALALLAVQQPPYRSAAVVAVSAAPAGEPVWSVAQLVRDVMAFERAVSPAAEGPALPPADELKDRVRVVIDGASFATVIAEYEGSSPEAARLLADAALPAGLAAARSVLPPDARLAVAAGPTEPRRAARPVLSLALAVAGMALVVGILAAILADGLRRCRASAG